MSASVAEARPISQKKRKPLIVWKTIVRSRYLYLMLLPVVAYYVIFCYLPMINTQTGGLLMVFKESHLNSPFSEWEWVGLKYFQMMWLKPDFWVAMRNTITISLTRLILEFPVPIILAVLLNEIRKSWLKRTVQTILIFPYFLSWIIVIGLMKDFLFTNGILNGLIKEVGMKPYNFLANDSTIGNYGVLVISNMFKNAGFGTVIYLAAISGIDPSLYEAAKIDGANRWHCILHITWPGIKSTVIVMLILACGNILNGSFDQILNLVNGVNRSVIETLDIYIYRYAFQQSMNQSFAAAAGLFKSVINFALLICANQLARRLTGHNLFS